MLIKCAKLLLPGVSSELGQWEWVQVAEPYLGGHHRRGYCLEEVYKPTSSSRCLVCSLYGDVLVRKVWGHHASPKILMSLLASKGWGSFEL